MKKITIDLTPEQSAALQPLADKIYALSTTGYCGIALGQAVNPNHFKDPNGSFTEVTFVVLDHDSANLAIQAVARSERNARETRIYRKLRELRRLQQTGKLPDSPQTDEPQFYTGTMNRIR